MSKAHKDIPSPALTKLSEVAPESISWLWPRRLARGKFTLIAGDPGLGKSRLTFDLAARITTGAGWPDGSGTATLGSVLWMCAEDGLGDTLRPAIETMSGDPDGVFVLDVNDGGTVRPVNLATDLHVIEAALADLGPQLLVIDPISAFLGRTDSYKDAEVRGMLAPLLKLIERHRVALLAIAHLSKDSQRAALHRPGGSVAFVAAARLVFAVAADPDDADRRIIAPLKANICKPAPSLAFRLPDGCVIWDKGSVSIGADTLLAPPMLTRDHHARDEAEAFLRHLLAAGPVESERVLREAQAAGITKNTARRAKDALNIVARKSALKGGWTWALPEGAHISSLPESNKTLRRSLRPFEDSEEFEDTHTHQGESLLDSSDDDDPARIQ